ncbi:MAG: stage II sporulation protein M [Rhodoferax sp.]|nr:stage II sporulation protein M [Rhodoferax sp.]
MTPLQFETANIALWIELDALLVESAKGKTFDGARLATLYRAGCEQLALAQSRAYPIHITQRLESLVQNAHQCIYQQHDYGVQRLRQLALIDFPAMVRQHRVYVAAATLLFALPMLVVGWATWRDPGFILHLLDAQRAREYDAMYSGHEGTLGRLRNADTDWQMFGFYIMNNIGIGFQCFAAGIFAGLGSAFFLVFNGLHTGAVAGYLIAGGNSENFLSFVVTHSAFELTAIVLAGAAGLRLGHALIAPGRLSRMAALKLAATQAVVLVYGVTAMLLVAAALEAFWSSARWVTPQVKYAVGACCWAFVLAYLGWQGRAKSAGLNPRDARNAG